MAAQPKLELVEATSPSIEDFEPLLVSTVEQLDTYWPQMAYWLEPCVEKAMHGEMVLGDIYNAIKTNRMHAIIAKCDTHGSHDVALVLVLEPLVYPKLSAINIVALGGRKLDLLKSKFWEHVCSWAFMNGARSLQASVSPAMARIIQRYGFTPVYTTMRLNLMEM